VGIKREKYKFFRLKYTAFRALANTRVIGRNREEKIGKVVDLET